MPGITDFIIPDWPQPTGIRALFTTRSVCVARYLPAALRLDSVEVRDDAFLVITISAEKRVFSEAALSKLGRCPSGGAR